jgi:hypothetical protein
VGSVCGKSGRFAHRLRCADGNFRFREQTLACGRECYSAARALDEPRVESLLQRFDLSAQRRLRYAELARRLAQAFMPSDDHEVMQLLERKIELTHGGIVLAAHCG